MQPDVCMSCQAYKVVPCTQHHGKRSYVSGVEAALPEKPKELTGHDRGEENVLVLPVFQCRVRETFWHLDRTRGTLGK